MAITTETQEFATFNGDDRPANGVHQERANGDVARLARALGWFSLGLGLLQVVAPRKVANLVGITDNEGTRNVMRAVGLREIASGAGILTQPRRSPWLWARVGGDALDLALLGSAMTAPDTRRGRTAAATAAVIGVTAADALCGARLGKKSNGTHAMTGHRGARPAGVTLNAAITVNTPLQSVYDAWEGFRSVPQFMTDFASVEVISERTSRWQAAVPGGVRPEWTVEITDSRPNEAISWGTRDGSPFSASGRVTFRQAPAGQGTEVRFVAQVDPPGGELGAKITAVFSNAIGQQIQNDLRRFKQIMEVGEVVVSDDSIVKGPNPARPPEQPEARAAGINNGG
jgi:uncharacterized membrane protein